jgi:hypothetical protein
MLDEMLAESGGPLTDRERVAADAALPSSPSWRVPSNTRSVSQRQPASWARFGATVAAKCGSRGHGVLTSDVDDLERPDASLRYLRV